MAKGENKIQTDYYWIQTDKNSFVVHRFESLFIHLNLH